MTRLFAVVDVETTGVRAEADRVIEVAIVRVERRRVTDRWRTYLRPDRPIPGWITRLTGIRDEDVRDAPTFDEISGEILRRLRGATFVAHNARFDHAFLRAEFTRAGRDWTPDVVCTVKLGRRLLPGLRSYGLDALTTHLGIDVRDRHRALGDAEATAELLLRLMRKRRAASEIDAQLARPSARRAVVLPPGAAELPATRGLWKLCDAGGVVLAAGHGINLKRQFPEAFAALPKRVQRRSTVVHHVPVASDVEARAALSAVRPPMSEPDRPFLTLTPDGRLVTGAPAAGRLFGPFRSMRDLRARLKRTEGRPLEDRLAEIVEGLAPVGLFRSPPPPPDDGPGVLVREGERLLWIQRGRLRRAWNVSTPEDEADVRASLRELLDAPFDAENAPPVRVRRGVPVIRFLDTERRAKH